MITFGIKINRSLPCSPCTTQIWQQHHDIFDSYKKQDVLKKTRRETERSEAENPTLISRNKQFYPARKLTQLSQMGFI